MTKFSKTLVVFVTFASVAFMAFALVARIGGPNYRAVTAELPEFVFEQAGPESPITVKTRTLKDETVGTGKIFPEAILAAQKRKIADRQAELQQLEREIPRVQAKVKEAKELIDADQLAIKKRQTALEKDLKNVVAEVTDTAAKGAAKSKEARAQYDVLKQRRQEWILMNNHLQEIRAQKVAALREARRLKDQLFQSQASLERAERRQQLLEADGATEVGDGAAAGYEDSSKPQAETTEPEEKQAE